MNLEENYVVVIGNGFLGNRVAWRAKGTKVFHVGHRSLEADISRLPSAPCTLVWCHGTSRGSDAEITDSQLGFMMRALRLLKASAACVSRHILLSSSHVYLDSTFGYVKRLCEDVILQEAQTSQVAACVIRVPNVYGVVTAAKPNSILSRWLCGDSQIRADGHAEIGYVSADQVANTVLSNLEAEGSAIIDIIPDTPLPVRSVGAEIARVRGLPFEVADFGQALQADIPPSERTAVTQVASLGLENIPDLVRGCEFARQLQARVRQSARCHNSACGERVLLDLEVKDIEHAKRVYTFNVAAGTKRGGHYHKEQTETFTVVKGHCELQILNSEGVSVSIQLSAGQKIEVLPGEDHTFWSPHSECVLIAVSDLAYIPNSVPDTYTYS
jgi:nucleoside-diphosphate-sugar epimerase/quercetin dioxygenase-like cupin family protein